MWRILFKSTGSLTCKGLLFFFCILLYPAGCIISIIYCLQFQKRNYAKLKCFKYGKKGYGLQLLENVSEGQFLIEYVGEVRYLLYRILETVMGIIGIGHSSAIFGIICRFFYVNPKDTKTLLCLSQPPSPGWVPLP